MLLARIGRYGFFHGFLRRPFVGPRIGAGNRRLPVQFRGATGGCLLRVGFSKWRPDPDPESEKGDDFFRQLGRAIGHVGLPLVSHMQVERTLLEPAGNEDDAATTAFQDPLIGGEVQT